MEAIAASMVDVVFPLSGASLPRDHRRALADALERALPGLTTWPGLGVHRINGVESGGIVLLSLRARLTLRVPRDQVSALAPLNGARLQVGACALGLGRAQVRELIPHGTLYSHLVTTDDDDELGFLDGIERDLAGLDIRGRPICGRRHSVSIDRGHSLTGFSLMLDGLSAPDSMHVLEAGLGLHRVLGCGVFVAHRSAAAVRA